MSRPMSTRGTAYLSATPLYFVVLAAILTLLVHPISAFAQGFGNSTQGLGNFATAAGAAAAEEAPRLNVPYDARGSVTRSGVRTRLRHSR